MPLRQYRACVVGSLGLGITCPISLYYVYKASRSCLLHFLCHPYIPHYWGERERAPPLMMSTALASVRPSGVRPPRTSRRLRMRDIHVIYADSNSADFAGFKNRLLSQCRKGTVRRDWNDVDNRNGRDVLEKRQRRETEGAVFETGETGKEDGLDVLRDVLLRLRSLSAYVHVYTRTLAHARPPNVQHFTSNLKNY